MSALLGLSFLASFAFDFLKGRIKQIPLLATDLLSQCAHVQESCENGRASQEKADEPIEEKRFRAEASAQNSFASDKHSKRGDERSGSKPASARASIESHAANLS